MPSKRRENVKEIVKELLTRQLTFTNQDVASRAAISRQATHAHLKALVAEGVLRQEGAGRGVRYRGAGEPAASEPGLRFELPLQGLQEDVVWKRFQADVPFLQDVPPRAGAILHFAATEMINNAIDHSGGTTLVATWKRSDRTVLLTVEDDGEGLFRHLQRQLGFADELQALQEVSKGKLTTAPEAHTGQGLFFTSKAVDLFVASSGAVQWVVDNLRDDVAVGALRPPFAGTSIRLELDLDTPRELKAVFDAYSNEDFAFSRTRTHVKLFAVGTAFVSRSEAKRLLTGLEKFEEVLLDFQGVDTVGQGFADEVFRVWARAHPGTRVSPANMNPAVASMVRRALPSS